MTKSPGQLAYEEDVRQRPMIDKDWPRRDWRKLSDYERAAWERDPVARRAFIP